MHTTLISAQDLSSHIADPNWVVLDCRHDLMDLAAGRQAYEAGHLPNAQFANLELMLSGAKRDAEGRFLGRHPLPDRDQFVAQLRDWGVNSHSQVVAYDAHGGMYAARLWWMLRWAGHAAVAVLDGGLPAWEAAGQALSTDTPRARAMGNIDKRDALAEAVTVNEVLANLQRRYMQVLDARAPDRFRGENETMDPVGGHIPGAKNRFFKDNLQADGRFKPAAELKAAFEPLIESADRTIAQCGSGVTACHNLLAMEIAGLPGAKLYPGSWSQWCSDSARPVATGAD
ncbi:MAG TPA: sulfurtransferase [Burkholderiaceae bacterium]